MSSSADRAICFSSLRAGGVIEEAGEWLLLLRFATESQKAEDEVFTGASYLGAYSQKVGSEIVPVIRGVYYRRGAHIF